MPTHAYFKYRIVTSAGDFTMSTEEDDVRDSGPENWIKANQESINSRFQKAAGNKPVKVTAIYSVGTDKSEKKIWGE